MNKNTLIQQADGAFAAAKELLWQHRLPEARDAFRDAYRIYRKYDKSNATMHDAAFFWALCLVECFESMDDLETAEDLLLRHVRDTDTFENISKRAVLAKAYTLMGKSKLARIITKELNEEACGETERMYTLVSTVYSLDSDRFAARFAHEALPLLRERASAEDSVALAIVLEALARSSEDLPGKERLAYAEELLALVKALGTHPLIPVLSDVYLLLSYISISLADWDTALFYIINTINTASCVEHASPQKLAACYQVMANIYDMKDDQKEKTKASFESLKLQATFSPDLFGCAEELQKISEEFSCWGEYVWATKSMTLAIRCLIDSDNFSYDQFRESILTLEKFARNLN